MKDNLRNKQNDCGEDSVDNEYTTRNVYIYNSVVTGARGVHMLKSASRVFNVCATMTSRQMSIYIYIRWMCREFNQNLCKSLCKYETEKNVFECPWHSIKGGLRSTIVVVQSMTLSGFVNRYYHVDGT